MPYTSLAMAAKFHTDPKLAKYVPEFDAASKGLKLPKYAPGSKARKLKLRRKKNGIVPLTKHV